MTEAARDDAVFVETAGRLHFGVLDLRGARGRWFGGLGAGAPGPTLLLSASPSREVLVTGEDADRAAEYVARFMAHHHLDGGVRLHVHRALPRHAGLGSGTQLALAVARAIAELRGIDPDTGMLARAVGRGRRSAVGTWTFAEGGLVVEGGRLPGAEACGPLIARVPFPPAWRCVVAVPAAAPSSLSGAAEEAAFASLPAPPQHEVEHVAHLVLMVLLPAIVEGDLAAFGRALTDIQQITGCWFAAVQGGAYAAGVTAELVRRMPEWGASGYGQSSWGPTVYGIVAGDAAAAELGARVAETLGTAGQIHIGPFRATGAHVWRPRVMP